MEYCYGMMSRYEAERDQIAEWIRSTRIELKKKVIRKESIEGKNKEMYTYLHDIFGARMTDMFDIRYRAEYK